MPIKTNLNVSPYFDDYDQTKDYYEILFKPGVALQTRELNQLQTILQRQIERFGDNIFMKGTIINGCNFTYNNAYPYAKILDLQIDGQPADVGAYVNLRAVNGSNLVSTVLGANVGYVSQAPDLNTLFLKYLNSGATYNQTSYSESDILTIYDANNTIFQVNVPVGGAGAGFSNNDTLVFMSAITIPSGITVGVGNTVNDLVSLANATVVSVNTTAIANTIVLGLAPYANALTNNSLTSAAWTFNTGNTVHINGTISTTITSIVGSSATGKIITNALGTITQVAMLTSGNGYTVSPGGASTFAPYVTVKTTNATTSVTSLGLTAQNYLAQVTVANNLVSGGSNAVGLGYSFSVSEGVVYQKGYFLYVAPQSLVVSKYSTTPDQISIGFKTDEFIIDSDFDSSLLDNSTGTFNALAPGADRLKLVPNLTAVATSDAVGNSDFFAITAFSLGLPYLQNQQTAYSAINDEMALRTYETNGDFVLDPFLLNTTTPKNASATTESTYFTAVVDPGEAYISGNRVKTYTNYSINVRQGTDTQVVNAVSVFLNYDSSIVVNDVGGLFNLTTGDYVTFYDTKKTYLSGTAWATINTSPAGNPIGTARIRSIQLLSGTPGTPAAQYKLYLYDINMNAGVNFRSANSVYFSNSTSSAIADIVLTYDAAANANVAIIANNTSTLLFNHGANGTANTNNSSYIYRDVFPLSTNGVIQFTLLSNTFSYNFGTNLTNSQLNELQVVFTANASAVNVSDVISVTNGSNTVVANTTAFSNANFITSYAAGDYIQVFKTGGTSDIKRISSIINATALQVDTNWGSSSNGISNLSIYFPQNIHTPLANRFNRYAILNSAGTQLTIDLGVKLTSLTAPVSVMYNGVSTASPTAKNARRNTSVVIVPSTNPGDLTGPWALGHPDIFRLRKVYYDTITNVINTASNVAMITLNSNAISGTFSSGEMVYQYTGQTNLTIGSISGGGSFTAGELVYQTVGSNTLYGTVFFVGSTYLVVNTDPGSPAEFVTGSTIVKNSSPTTANASVTAVTHFNTNVGVITAIYSGYKTIINNVQIGNVTSFEVRTNNTTPVATIYNNSKLWGLTSSANGLVLTSSSAANNQTVVSSLPATAVDVTNEFYINHNQNLDFYDQGFLYKNPKSLLNVDSNTALIAYFDHFTTTPGFYTKSSYPVDDTRTFAELTTTATTVINTLEIPELTTQTGNTYDLIDQVDFRPSVVATANITNGVLASSSINPIIAPANAKFSTASTMRFPVPGSKYTSDITQYAGRIDRVIIDNSNDIKVISGRAELNNLKAPNLPANTLSINLMNIPPYPSLPSVLSNNQISILDKKILNEGVNEQRVVNHTIGVPKLTPQQQEISQPVRYTMSDIANLEARIKALEYYVALSQLEKSVTNVAIPSNVNANINRFKYGFFADNFDSKAYTDVKNTQLTTIIDDNQEVVPGKFMKNISVDVNLSDVATVNCVTGSLITLPYHYSNGFASVLNLINQNVATVTGWDDTSPPPLGTMTSTPRTFTIETTVLVANTTPPKPTYTTLLGEVGTASTSVVTGGYMLNLFGISMSTPTVTTKYATQWGGSAKTFIVPDGVYSILVYVWGAGGGAGGGGSQNTTWGAAGGAGGSGGFVKAYVKVTPGQKIEAFAGTGGGGGGVSNGYTGLSPAGYSSIPGATRKPPIRTNTGGGGGGGSASGIVINGTLVLYAGGGGGGAGASFHQDGDLGNPGGIGGGGTNYAEWDPRNFTYNGGGGGNRNGVGGTGSSSPNYVNLTYVTSIVNNLAGLNGVIPNGGASRGTTQPYFIQKLGAGGDSVQKDNGLPGYHGKVAILY